MKNPFTYTDLFNLEYFLSLDSAQNQDYLHERDRQIFLSLDDRRQSDRSLIRGWIDKRNAEETNAGEIPGPGGILSDSFKLVAIFLSLFGFSGGLFAGLAFFTYTGEAPVNVFHFLILFVFSQFLLLLFVIAAATVSKVSARSRPLSGITTFYTYLAAVLAGRIKRGLTQSVTPNKRDRYLQTAGLIKKARSRYGFIMIWPFFLLSQKIMIAMNMGVLSSTLFKIITSDLAFGWQSTLDISSRALFVMVKVLAAPWAWAVPENIAFPSEDAIEGSRIFLKDGIYHLASSDLTAWWPFLLLCLLCYGLLPRLLLFLIGSALQKKSLNRLEPDSPEARMVLQRMKTPKVSTSGTDTPPQDSAASGNNCPEDIIQPEMLSRNGTILLVPEDISEAHDISEITRRIEKLGYKITQIATVMAGYESDRSLFQELAEHFRNQEGAVILVMESWMPPIGDTFSFLKDLRKSLNSSLPCYLGLLEYPEQVQDDARQLQAVKIWKNKIDMLGDPCLSVISLGRPRGATGNDP